MTWYVDPTGTDCNSEATFSPKRSIRLCPSVEGFPVSREESFRATHLLSGAVEEVPIVNHPGNFSDLLEKVEADGMMEALRQMKKLDQQLAKKTIAAKKMKKGDNKEETYKSGGEDMYCMIY
ncbi:hypothetical protein PROFUN_11369 [Planoprotostelium fungivorum]|uniref:Uncharacterized protein n=1 Tax=Planoprotostelium fungivorum TaxID=1890364 RepID=A0A2P6N2Z1_9EUKA|nr:hypothetical protein PROFUN_11369 [Planoprotostelium fungivorum]